MVRLSPKDFAYAPTCTPTRANMLCVYVLMRQSLMMNPDFQHILRILNTNIDGRI